MQEHLASALFPIQRQPLHVLQLFHIKSERDLILKRAKEIAAAGFAAAREAKLVMIIASGDIAFGGDEDQYRQAEIFLAEIKAALQPETSAPIEFVTVPGNHDCDFTKNNRTREMLVDTLTGPNPGPVDDSVIESCTVIQGEYFKFRDRLEGAHPPVTPFFGAAVSLWRERRFRSTALTFLGFRARRKYRRNYISL
jgi:hypothetical protein